MAELWFWLNTPPTVDQVLDPFAVVYVLVFGVGFVASAYLNGPHAAPLARNPIQREGIVHWSHVGLWVFGPGLFFFGVRALQINPLSMGEPIWLVASVIAAVITGVRCVQWWRDAYPRLLAADDFDSGYGYEVPAQEDVPLLDRGGRNVSDAGTRAAQALPLQSTSASRLRPPTS